MYAHLQLIGQIAGFLTSLPVEIDERFEPTRFAAYDCNHQWESKQPSTNE
jgi:hypothetical protein